MERGIFCIAITLLSIIVCISCSNREDEKTGLEISNPEGLDSILDHYVEEGFYPFIYARLEDIDGNLLYEHSFKVLKRLLRT